MAYFAALLAHGPGQWVARETDLDDVADLDDLADLMREAAVDEGPVFMLIEQEDTWFAVVRVDGDDDPRVFVSDVSAVRRSPYRDMLLPGADLDALTPLDSSSLDDELVELRPATGPYGDHELLEEFGTPPEVLLELCDEEGMLLPAEALTEIAERAGGAEALESVR